MANTDQPPPAASAAAEAVAAARAAGLRYTNDRQPGFRRVGPPSRFRYLDTTGQRIDDDRVLQRIRALAIPPAWTDVWICPNPRGHIQVTARDVRGRKQYRYHPEWRARRDETKYDHLIAFAVALPAIREQTERDLARPGLPREKVLATVVRLLELTRLRIGNVEYARANGHYGLTTLQNRHADVTGSALRFHFVGKSGKQHTVGVRDRRLARVVKRCQELPGQELFQYVDDEGNRHVIESDDVNEYLRAITGGEFTAKDFRTWAGTVLAAWALQELDPAETVAQANKRVAQAIKDVAMQLGNTVAVCRQCYVHPAVIEAYRDGSLRSELTAAAVQVDEEVPASLPSQEAAVLGLLRRRQASDAQPVGPRRHIA